MSEQGGEQGANASRVNELNVHFHTHHHSLDFDPLTGELGKPAEAHDGEEVPSRQNMATGEQSS